MQNMERALIAKFFALPNGSIILNTMQRKRLIIGFELSIVLWMKMDAR